MTGVSITSVQKGSNVNAPDFTTATTEQSSTANDGMYDVIFKNFTSVSRTASVTTTAENKLKLEAKMKVGNGSILFHIYDNFLTSRILIDKFA